MARVVSFGAFRSLILLFWLVLATYTPIHGNGMSYDIEDLVDSSQRPRVGLASAEDRNW